MKFSIANGSILGTVLTTVLVSYNFTPDCASQLLTIVPTALTGLIGWTSLYFTGHSTLGGFKRA